MRLAPSQGLMTYRWKKHFFANSDLSRSSRVTFQSRTRDSDFQELWQPTAPRGIKWGTILVWCSCSARNSLTASPHRLKPAVAAKTTTSFETTVAAPGLWKTLRIRLTSKVFFDTSLGLQPRKNRFKFVSGDPREFPVQLSPAFRLGLSENDRHRKKLCRHHDDRWISDVPAFFRGLRSAVSVERGEKCKPPLESPESCHGEQASDIS